MWGTLDEPAPRLTTALTADAGVIALIGNGDSPETGRIYYQVLPQEADQGATRLGTAFCMAGTSSGNVMYQAAVQQLIVGHAEEVGLVAGQIEIAVRFVAPVTRNTMLVEDRLHVHDIHSTILHLMGMDHTRLTYRYSGRDFRLTDVGGKVIDDWIA